MAKDYSQGIKKILIYSVLLTIITLIYLYFGKIWDYMSKISFLNANIVIPITNFLNMYGKGLIIAILLSIGIIISVILLYLIARQILKIINKR